MRDFSTVLAGQLRRKTIVNAGIFVLVFIAANAVSGYILSGDTSSLVYIGVAGVAAVIVVTILNNWRNGLYLFLAWLLFEDLIRKYLGNNMVIYFGKDFLAAVVYISFVAAIRRKEVQSFRPPFLVPLMIFFWFGVLQVFNPASPNLVFGGLGLKLYFYYIPLVFVGYALLETEADLRRFFSFNLLLAVVIGGLGIIQSILGHTFLNPAKPAEDIRELSTLYRVAPISGVIAYRPTSVFVSTGRFVSYMVLAWLVAFGFGGYLLLRHKGGRTLAFFALAVTTVAVILSASRGAVLWTAGSALIGAGAFLWGAPWRQREVIRVLRFLQRTLIVSGIALAIFILLYPEEIGARMAFYTETLSPDSPASELVYRTRDYPIRNLLFAFDHPRWPYGYGIGTCSLGVQYIAHLLHVRSPVNGVESGYGTLVIELGVVGLALWLLWTFALVATAWKVVRRLRGSPWFPLGFMIFWYAFLLLFPFTFNGMQPYQDFVLNAYLWLLVGILLRLPHIAPSSQSTAVTTVKRPFWMH